MKASSSDAQKEFILKQDNESVRVAEIRRKAEAGNVFQLEEVRWTAADRDESVEAARGRRTPS